MFVNMNVYKISSAPCKLIHLWARTTCWRQESMPIYITVSTMCVALSTRSIVEYSLDMPMASMKINTTSVCRLSQTLDKHNFLTNPINVLTLFCYIVRAMQLTEKAWHVCKCRYSPLGV